MHTHTGPTPVGRVHAAACFFRGNIYLFGGCNGAVASSFRNDLMILDLESLNWMICVPTTPLPAGLAIPMCVCMCVCIYMSTCVFMYV
jgi:hypothetical protein